MMTDAERKRRERENAKNDWHPVRGRVKGEDLPTWDKINVDAKDNESSES